MKNRTTTLVLLLVIALIFMYSNNISAKAVKSVNNDFTSLRETREVSNRIKDDTYDKEVPAKLKDKRALDEWVKDRDNCTYLELNIRDTLHDESSDTVKVVLPKLISSIEIRKASVYTDTTNGFSVFIETFSDNAFIDKYIQSNKDETAFNNGEIDIWYESEELTIINNTYEDYELYDIITYKDDVGIVYEITDYTNTPESKDKVIEYMNELELDIKIA